MHPRIPLTILLLFLPPLLLAADPAKDRNGDPLPEGAVARFGDARLLHGGVGHVEFSPDGKSLATSGSDGGRIWDAATGKEVLFPHLPRTGEALLTFLPDGGHVVGDHKGCRVIDPKTGKVRCFWRNPGDTPHAIVVAGDGKSAVTAWREGGVTVHDLTGTGKPTSRMITEDKVQKLAISGNGRFVAYARGKAVLLWDVRKDLLLLTHEARADTDSPIQAVALSHDGSRLAIAAEDGFRLFDTATRKEVEGWSTAKWHSVFLRFSADGKELTGVSLGGEVLRLSAETGKVLASTRPRTERELLSWNSTLSPDGRTLAVVSGGRVSLWDAGSGKELVPVERGPLWRGIAFVKPGVLATWTRGQKEGEEESLAFWDVAAGKLLRRHTVPAPKSEWWRRDLSPDGKLFAGADDREGVVLIDPETGKQVRRLQVDCRKDEQAKFAFSPDGRTIVTSNHRGVMLWDVASGRQLRELDGVGDGAIAVSPDGRCVASAFVGQLLITEVATGKVRFRLVLPKEDNPRTSDDVVERIEFSRDGRAVVTISRAYLRVFSTTDARTVLRLDSGSWASTAALSPDGRWLAHADRLGVAVRDLHSRHAGGEYQSLAGHSLQVEGLAFSPDGKYLASCGDDSTVLVWDARRLTGKPSPPDRDTTQADADDLGHRWEALGDINPARAAKAMAALIASPEGAVALLKARLKPVAEAPAERIERLVRDLDSEDFEVRQKAMKELTLIPDQAAPALRKALAGKPSAEVKRAAENLLAEVDGATTDPERLRQVRAVEVLERIGSPGARELVEALAKGAAEARLTQEAKAALDRWAAR